MDERLSVLKLDIDSFQRWLQAGIIRISPSLFIALPLEWQESDETQTDVEQLPFLVQLPEKYARIASAQASSFALVDEVKAISLPTETLTHEWQTRMRNLGEEWLPFEFRSDWVETRPTEEVADVDDEISPGPSTPSAEEVPPQEILPVEPEPGEQQERAIDGHAEAESEPASETETAVEEIAEAEQQVAESEAFQQVQMPGLLLEDNEPKPQEDYEAAESQALRKKKRKVETTSQEQDTDVG